MFDKSGSTKTLIGIQSGGAGCGSVRYKDAPKWWMRVCISTENIFSYELCNLPIHNIYSRLHLLLTGLNAT